MNTAKVMFYILKLISKITVLIPSLVLKRNSGMKAFKTQLKLMDIDPKVISELCHEYKSIIDIKSLSNNIEV